MTVTAPAPVRAFPTGLAPRVRLLGIRHHGPGSARAILSALSADPPDVLLVEVPAEAERIVALVGHDDMVPPVAMLGHVVGRPDRAVFLPFASFSPEWVAFRWAIEHDVPVRCIDLPLRFSLATGAGDQPQLTDVTGGGRPVDPIADLAAAAGYDDPERWWEDVIEHRSPSGTDAAEVFAALADVMTELRSRTDPELDPADVDERRREACMRIGLREAMATDARRIDVVCGAWHVPALAPVDAPGRARADARALTGLAKAKVALTWVPWTHRRLASATGYGAGVTAPGWYDHLFTHHGPDVIVRWFAQAARILRAADVATSAADVVEATRLAHSLAGLRGRPLAGLAEVGDAARAVLGHGSDQPMRVLSADLVVGRRIGAVPASTPMVPLARDLADEQRRCRLRPEAGVKTLELDLRKPLDLRRSHLLHRLELLGVPWAYEAEGRGTVGTFRETWQLRWEPEVEIRLIESAALGTTVASASAASALQRAESASGLAELTGLLERALLADLPDAVGELVHTVGDRMAVSADHAHLVEALVPLARSLRYGDVRSTDADALRTVVRGIAMRIGAGLVPAAVDLDDDTSEVFARRLRETQSALALVGEADLIALFHRGLTEIVERDRVHGLVQGLAARMLADASELSEADIAGRVSRALSAGTPALEAAAFVEGFLGGAGTVLVHDPVLLGLLDDWLSSLAADSFVAALPLVRRTFGAFEAAERRTIGERVRFGRGGDPGHERIELDPERVAAGLTTMAHLLGVSR